ncbi:MAG: hypothetical protein JRD02_08210 [Deltaproteobacteria bacterium]|nr:hypothetical protein [Deltaproteobacteria bacterium]
MEKNAKISSEESRKRKKIAKEIEAAFEKLHGSVYSKGQFYENEFFIRSDYALVILNRDDEILVSFADHTRPSYAAFYALTLDDIEDTDLFICKDYKTDEKGSMIITESDRRSTGAIIWPEKERYYDMLKQKVNKIVIRKQKKDNI